MPQATALPLFLFLKKEKAFEAIEVIFHRRVELGHLDSDRNGPRTQASLVRSPRMTVKLRRYRHLDVITDEGFGELGGNECGAERKKRYSHLISEERDSIFFIFN